jgi:hypothetical protein
MAPTPAHHEIAAFIDKEVSAYPDTAGGMEQLLMNMYKGFEAQWNENLR